MSQPFYIAFDEAHKPRGRIDGNYTQLKDYLQTQGFGCQSFMEFPITRQNLAPYDILVCACPDNSKFSKEEIDAIATWVREDGGGLLLLSHAGGDKGRRSNLSDLAERFGFYFENDQVLDKHHNFGMENLPELDKFSPPHPITEGIGSICYRAGCSLTTSGLNAIPVVISSEESEPFSSPLIIAVEMDQGHAVGIGSYELFRDKIPGGFNQDNHDTLANNIFNWLKSEYRAKIKSGEVKPKVSFNPPPSAMGISNISGIQNGAMGLPGNAPLGQLGSAPQPIGFQQFNIQSTIQISNKSDLANLLNSLLNQCDIMKQQIQSIINSVIASEEQLIGTQSQHPEYGVSDIDNIGKIATNETTSEDIGLNAPPKFEAPPSKQPYTGGLLGLTKEEEKPLSALPPRPPALLKKPQFGASPVSYESNTPPQAYDGSPTVFDDTSSNQQIVEQPQEAVEEPFSQQPAVEEKEPSGSSKKELKAELETLESKLASIEDLRQLVESKHKKKDYNDKQYEKQMERLENDKKRANFRIEEIKNLLKKAK